MAPNVHENAGQVQQVGPSLAAVQLLRALQPLRTGWPLTYRAELAQWAKARALASSLIAAGC